MLNTIKNCISLRLIGDDVRYVERPWRTSPPFESLKNRLSTGDELDLPEFPVLYIEK